MPGIPKKRLSKEEILADLELISSGKKSGQEVAEERGMLVVTYRKRVLEHGLLEEWQSALDQYHMKTKDRKQGVKSNQEVKDGSSPKARASSSSTAEKKTAVPVAEEKEKETKSLDSKERSDSLASSWIWGLAAIAILGGVVWFIARASRKQLRQRQQQQQQQEQQQQQRRPYSDLADKYRVI